MLRGLIGTGAQMRANEREKDGKCAANAAREGDAGFEYYGLRKPYLDRMS